MPMRFPVIRSVQLLSASLYMSVLLSGFLLHAEPRKPDPARRPQTAAPANSADADAQKKLAASLGFVDIVGIKLGMSPQEVTAALKVSSPGFVVKTFTTVMIIPSTGANVPVPHYIVAHKSPAPAPDHSQEYIIVEFTLPPVSPVADRVYRKVQFGDGKGPANSTVISAMKQKYGMETDINAIWHHWMFQNSGQLLTKGLTGTAAACESVNTNQDGSFGNPPVNDSVVSTAYGDNPIGLQFESQPDSSDVIAPCSGYVAVVGTVNSANYSDPSAPAISMSVAMQSAALIHDTRASVRNWLQADLDAKNNKTKSDAASQPAPKL